VTVASRTHPHGHERRTDSRPPRPPIAVLAMGGHAFIQPGQVGTEEEQAESARQICRQVMTLVERGYNLIITHGNGPQVGNLLLRNEIPGVPKIPLDVLVAQTEGSLGYYLQQAMLNELRQRDIARFVVTVITQVVVDADDPAFDKPTKPVGPTMTGAEAALRKERLGWVVGEDPGRGHRRLVPSPNPRRVIQRDMIRETAEAGHIVIACGGGGIPVTKQSPDADYVGVEAVIDKDLTSAVLAADVNADLLIILTSVDQVFVEFGKPTQKALGAVTLAECERLIADGHFHAGSMGPKVQAVLRYLKQGGRRGLITSPESLASALDGEGGTHFVGRI
jgi:carbamate kinase